MIHICRRELKKFLGIPGNIENSWVIAETPGIAKNAYAI